MLAEGHYVIVLLLCMCTYIYIYIYTGQHRDTAPYLYIMNVYI